MEEILTAAENLEISIDEVNKPLLYSVQFVFYSIFSITLKNCAEIIVNF